MKVKSVLAVLIITLSLGIAADVSALGFPKIPGMDKLAGTGSNNNAKSMDGVLTQQEGLVKAYRASLNDIGMAQALLLEAYGKKEEAAKLRSGIDAMANGPVDRAQMKKSQKLSEKANKYLSSKMKEEVALTDEGRKKFQQALLPYATGVVEMTNLVPEFKGFLQSAVDQLSSASLMEKMKVKKKLDVGLYIAKAAPVYITKVASTTKSLVTYAKKQGVSEQTADKALAAVGTL